MKTVDHSRYLKTATEFANSNPLGNLIVCKLLMFLFAKYVDKKLYYSSNKFKYKQDFDTIKSMSARTGIAGKTAPRLPAWIAYESKEEEVFIDSVNDLLKNSVLWEAIPPAARTANLRCLSFRMLSAAGCMIFDG